MTPSTFALLIGTTLSAGMGESPGIEAKLSSSFWNTNIEVLASSSDKYTGRGYILRGQMDFSLGPTFLGVAYSVRNGGDWEKEVLWIRTGMTLKLFEGKEFLFSVGPEVETAVKSRNREVRGSLCLKLDWKDFRFSSKTSLTSHLQGTGLTQSFFTGVTF